MAKKRARSSATRKQKAAARRQRGTVAQRTAAQHQHVEPEDSVERTTGGSGVLVNCVGDALPTVERPFVVESIPSPDQFVAEESIRRAELDRQRRRARRVMKTVEEPWWDQEGVVGVNVAYRTKLGHIVSPLQVVIQVDVTVKMAIAGLRESRRFIFPRSVDGVPVKVREMRYVSSSSCIPNVRTQSIIGGIRVAPTTAATEWGTLGICVPHETDDDLVSLLGISNSHVVGQPGTTVQSPSGEVSAENTFGEVLRSSLTRFADVASIQRLDEPGNREFEGGVPDSAFPVNELRYLRTKFLRDGPFQDVFKTGACTGTRAAVITNRRAAIAVPDLLADRFENVIEAIGRSGHEVTDAGDSGSVLIGRHGDEWVVIGLNFAMSASRKLTYAIPFGQVISRLRLKIPDHLLWPVN